MGQTAENPDKRRRYYHPCLPSGNNPEGWVGSRSRLPIVSPDDLNPRLNHEHEQVVAEPTILANP